MTYTQKAKRRFRRLVRWHIISVDFTGSFLGLFWVTSQQTAYWIRGLCDEHLVNIRAKSLADYGKMPLSIELELRRRGL